MMTIKSWCYQSECIRQKWQAQWVIFLWLLGVINRTSYDFSHSVLLYGLCCLRTTLQKRHLDRDQSQTMNESVAITPLVRHFIEYNLSASSAFTISFCHSSSAPLISFILSISPTPSLFSHLSHFYLFSLSFYFFHLVGRNEGKESASKTQRKVSLYLSCSAIFLVKG